jgi:DNA-binding beta-propeller fold protein YncE
VGGVYDHNRMMVGQGRIGFRQRRALGGALAAVALGAGAAAPARADLPPGGGPFSGVVSNFGRLIAPRGDLTQLGKFPAGAAVTPDGRFVWTVNTGRDRNTVQISDLATGVIVQELDNPADERSRGKQGGVVIAPDGRAAYVSDTRDRILAYAVDPATGRATYAAAIDVPPPGGTPPPDDFPPRASGAQSYPAGLAVTPDGRTLVAALNLDDRVALIDTHSRAVQQVQVRGDGAPGDRAYPEGVAIAGGRAFVTDEGDGTVASFELADPAGTLKRVQPAYDDPSGLNPKRTHPHGVVASPDGSRVYVSLTAADQVLELAAADPSRVLRRFDLRHGDAPGTQPTGLAITPDGGTLLVAMTGEDVVRAIALRDHTVPAAASSAGSPPVAPAAQSRRIVGRRTARCRTVRRRVRGHLRHVRVCPRRKRKVSKRRKHGKTRAAVAPAAASLRAAGPPVVTIRAGTEIAAIPAGIYPRAVAVTPDTGRLVITGSKGVGPGSTFDAGESVSHHILGVLQRIALPAGEAARDAALRLLGQGGDDVAVPVNGRDPAPGGTPLMGPDGGTSSKIKYVFYVVTENKTYDVVLGDLASGQGDPCLALFGERRVVRTKRDGSPCPTSGYGATDADVPRNPGQSSDGTPITPNEHRLARDFVTLDNTYADSETSDDGHIWTSSAYGPEYDVRTTLADNGESPHPFDLLYPVSTPPKGFFFDSAVRQGVSFFNYGEAAAGLAFPDTQSTPEELATRAQVLANSEYVTQYPSSGAIDVDPITRRETYDHDPGAVLDPTKKVSRMQYFRKRFAAQVAACADPSNPATCAVPRYNELLFPNNHTSGTTPGRRTPDALVRDTDAAIGQLVDDISHSKIWPYSAIFVVQDDAQGGADHIDGHRITSLVASPYARRGAVVAERYDHVSVIRTIELILGMKPTYLYDALARPMWEAFTSTPNAAPYDRTDIPEALTEERNGTSAPMAATSARQRWQVADAVPEDVANQVMWAYRYGTAAACPQRTGIVPNDPCHHESSSEAFEARKAAGTLAALRAAARR